MTLSKALNIYVFVLFFLMTSVSNAQNSINELNEKMRLEKEIKQMLNETLRSRLSESDFNTEVEVKLMYVNSQMLNSDEYRYKKSSQEKMQLVINNSAQLNYEIENVKVDLQLSSAISEKYKANLSSWLNNWTDSYFGKKGQANVSYMNASPDYTINKQTTGDVSFAEQFYRLQNFMGMVFLGLIFAGLWFLSRRQKVATNVESHFDHAKDHISDHISIASQMSYQMNRQASPQLGSHATGAGHVNTVALIENQSANAQLLSTQNKVAALAANMPTQMKSLMAHWAATDVQDFIKITAFIEAWSLFSAEMNHSAKERFTLNLTVASQAQLQSAISQFLAMDDITKIGLYQQIYTSLLSESVAEKANAHYQFEFIESLGDAECVELFRFLKPEFQLTFLMKAPKLLVHKITRLFSNEYIVNILMQATQTQEASEPELYLLLVDWQKNHSHKKHVTSAEDKLMQLSDVMSTLPRRDKALLLNKMCGENPHLLKQAAQDLNDSLNGMKYWSPENIKKFCLKSKSRDLAAAVKNLPFLEPIILGVCPDTMKSEIAHEMSYMDDKKCQAAFNSFLLSFDSYTLDSNVINIKNYTEKVS